jgi:hypothetical protein
MQWIWRKLFGLTSPPPLRGGQFSIIFPPPRSGGQLFATLRRRFAAAQIIMRENNLFTSRGKSCKIEAIAE